MLFLLFLFLDFQGGATIKYFLVQAVSSALFIWGVLIRVYEKRFSSIIIIVGAIIKLGAAPFHFWYVRILETLSWLRFFFLSSFQKILPFFILRIVLPKLERISTVIIIVGGIRVLGAFFQNLIKRVLAYSRVYNLSFLIILLSCPYEFILFFIFYNVSMAGIIGYTSSLGIRVIGKLEYQDALRGFSWLVLIGSLSGVPPFIGFWVKLIVLYQSLLGGWWILIGISLIFSIFILVVYLFSVIGALYLEGGFYVWGTGTYYFSLIRWVVSSPLVFYIFCKILISINVRC